MRLYMTELGITHFATAVEWWSRLFGVSPTLQDPVNGFALFEVNGGRIALKSGRIERGTLHLEVDDLATEMTRLQLMCQLKASEEGYVRAKLTDPDGNVIVLFQWTRHPTGLPVGGAGVSSSPSLPQT